MTRAPKTALSPIDQSGIDAALALTQPEVEVTITERRNPVKRALLERLMLGKEAAHAAD